MTKNERAELDARYQRGLESAQKSGKPVPCWEHAIRGCTTCSRGAESVSSRELSRESVARAGGPAFTKDRSDYPECPSCRVKYKAGPGANGCGICGHVFGEEAA
jgi:hypothetical protein